MDYQRSIDPIPRLRLEAAPALLPAVGLLAGTCAAPGLIYLPTAAVACLIALGLALPHRAGPAIAALALGLLSGGLHTQTGPAITPLRPVEVIARIAGHPVRHDDETFFYARVSHWRQGVEITPGAFDLQVMIPPDAPPPAIGSTVRLRGYLKRSAGFANLPSRDPGPWRLRLKSARFLTLEAPPGRLMGLAGWLRGHAERSLESVSARPGAALVRALVLGDRSRLPKPWRQALRRSGLAHLTAVSGLHVGLLAGVLLLAGGWLPRPLRYLPALAGVGVYLLLIGPQPAVLRASLMGILALTALMLHRPPQGTNTLACCVAAMALVDPSVTGRLGFQLSVAATAGILMLAPLYVDRWRWLPAAFRRPLAASVSAQLLTLPWILPLAGGVHPLATLLNLAAIPYLAGCLVLAFLWLIAAVTWSAVAAPALQILDAMASPLEGLAQVPPGPAFFLPLSLAPEAAPILAAVAIAAGLRPLDAIRLGLVVWLAVQTGARFPAPVVPELVVLDVGQGDAVLLRDGRRTLLVDGGGWRHGDLGGRVVVPALAALGVRRVDALVLTHPDRDHCGGLTDLALYLPVGEIWMGPGWTDGACAAELLAAPVARWRVLWRGEVERRGRWRLEVLHPAAGLRRGRNDRSLVLAAEVAGHRLLLTGDVEASVERRLVGLEGEDLASDVLKVAHHGSKTSSTGEFLDAVHPRLALVSAGPGNPHGHPHEDVLRRLRASGARVLRTDRSGMIRLRFHRFGEISIELPGAPRRGSPLQR